MDIRFEQSTITGYALSGIIAIAIAAAAVIVWRVRTKEKIFPIAVGAVTFIVFAEILKAIPVIPLFTLDNAVSRAVNSTPWLYYLVAGLLAGIFEETGRYVAFRFVLKNHTERPTAISYGIGHGAIEAVILSIGTLSVAAIGASVNNGMLPALMANIPEDMQETYLAQLADYASKSFGSTMLWIPERIAALFLQIALSVLVFRAVRDDKFMLYPIAMGLHALIDFMCVFYKVAPAAFEIGFVSVSLVIFIVVMRTVYADEPSGDGHEKKNDTGIYEAC